MKPPFGFAVYLSHAEVADDQLWQASMPDTVKDGHVNRRRDWITSRTALQKAFQAAGLNLSAAEFKQENSQTLQGVHDFKFSLSHSNLGAIAWVVPTSLGQHIGVDIEEIDRPVSDKVKQKFISASDHPEVSAIKIWSLKEAVFKSIPNEKQIKIEFTKIEIKPEEFFVPVFHITGKWQQIEEKEQICSFSWWPYK